MTTDCFRITVLIRDHMATRHLKPVFWAILRDYPVRLGRSRQNHLARHRQMECEINGVSVSFPYTPYPVQVNYMSKVIESIRDREYSLLESPTGTGKTLSLLCAALSWTRESSKETIVYASRTHSQLSNVVKELKKTRFRPTVSHIASRTKLCLNDAVRRKSPGLQSSLCRLLRSQKACQYHFDDKMTTEANELTKNCIDIEDFIDECRKRQYCPYLVAQLNSQTADLVLTPYTYIIDPAVREHLPLDIFLGSILIFDEAHNIPDALSGGMSFDLPFNLIKGCKDCLTRLVRSQVEARVKGKNQLETARLGHVTTVMDRWYVFFERLSKRDEQFASLMSVSSKEHEATIQKDGKWLFDMLECCGVNETTVGEMTDTLDSIGVLAGAINLQQHEQTALDRVGRLFKIIYKRCEGRDYNVKFIDDYFAVCLTNEPALSLICFSPKPGFEQVTRLSPRTIIMTSGTLSPMKSFAGELGYSFPVQLENEHVADPSQVFVGVVPRGLTGKQFLFTYQYRKDQAMKKELIETMKDTFARVPAGVLTFFPSFAMLEEYRKLILIQQGSMHKTLFIEPRENEKLTEVLKSFERKANSDGGAAMLAVCRGKTSEGLDFADDAARCVCVVGIPFPNASDFRVNLKRDWMEKKQKGSGSRWYTESAMRAVNQAIGRAIRHKEDYAAVLLFDERYMGFKQMVSKWIQPSIHEFASWDELVDEFEYFFAKRQGITKERRKRHHTPHQAPVESPFTLSMPETRRKPKKQVHKREEPAPEMLDGTYHLVPKKPSRPTKDLGMEAELGSLFSSSMTESQKEESQKRKFSAKDQALSDLFGSQKRKGGSALLEQLTKKAVPVAKQVAKQPCAQCKDPSGIKRDCGHYLCQQCFEFNKALGGICAMCSGK